jgi:hypothetical protein
MAVEGIGPASSIARSRVRPGGRRAEGRDEIVDLLLRDVRDEVRMLPIDGVDFRDEVMAVRGPRRAGHQERLARGGDEERGGVQWPARPICAEAAATSDPEPFRLERVDEGLSGQFREACGRP